VELNHRDPARDRFRSVNLDLVVILGVSKGGKQTDDCEGENYSGCGSDCQRGRLVKGIEKACAFYNNPGGQRQEVSDKGSALIQVVLCVLCEDL